MHNSELLQKELVKNASYRLDESLRMIEIALQKIDEEQLWLRPNDSLNSIGSLMLHLCGNMTQYGISSLRNTKDKRNRDMEFSTSQGYTKPELLKKLRDTVFRVKSTFESVSLERLVQEKNVQGFKFSGVGNIIHVVEHFSFHTGQIAFWVKQLNNEQLGFYDGHDLNAKNTN